MTWTAPEVERSQGLWIGDEHSVLESWFNFHRDTLLHKCAGLTEEQLKTASVEPSPLTLLGLLRHLTELERWWRSLFTGDTFEPPYMTEESPDASIFDIESADARADYELYRTEIELTRKAVSLRGLEEIWEKDGQPSGNLRAMYVHLIEEYARHSGHADLIRERIDGKVGT